MFRTPEQLAAEARRAFSEHPETPEQHIDRLIRAGFINAKGQVTKLLGGTAEPEEGAPKSPPPLVSSG